MNPTTEQMSHRLRLAYKRRANLIGMLSRQVSRHPSLISEERVTYLMEKIERENAVIREGE